MILSWMWNGKFFRCVIDNVKITERNRKKNNWRSDGHVPYSCRLTPFLAGKLIITLVSMFVQNVPFRGHFIRNVVHVSLLLHQSSWVFESKGFCVSFTRANQSVNDCVCTNSLPILTTGFCVCASRDFDVMAMRNDPFAWFDCTQSCFRVEGGRQDRRRKDGENDSRSATDVEK